MASRQLTNIRRKQNKLSMFLVSLVVVLMLTMVAIKSADLSKKIEEKKQEELVIDAQIDAEKQRGQEIEQYAKEVQTKGFYEKMAREKLGLVYEGEVLFKEEQ